MITREMLKKMLENNDSMPMRVDLHVAVKYLKWLGYTNSEFNSRINELKNKDVESLSIGEMEELNEFNKEVEILPRFQRYVSGECLKEDILPVYDFMQEVSLNSIIDRKITSEDKEEALKILDNLYNLSLKNLFYLVGAVSNNNYLDLNIVDAYVAEELTKYTLKKEKEAINFGSKYVKKLEYK